MQQSDDRAPAGVSEHVAELETLCTEIESSLCASDWKRFDAAIANSRRARHAFENAMAETAGTHDAEFERAIFTRLQRVFAVRDDQMKRLQAIHDGIGERLRAISRWKQYARAVGGSHAAQRPPALFVDVR